MTRRWRWSVAIATALLAGVLGAPAAQAATVDPTAWYVLVNRNSGKAVEVQNSATADGGPVVQYTDHSGTNQQWQLVRMSSDPGGGVLPSTFRWSSSGVLAGPKPGRPALGCVGDQGLLRGPVQQPVAGLRDHGEPVRVGPGELQLQ